jgi:DNA-binding beta-propeller fold protein YncE
MDWLPDGTFFVTDGYGNTRVVKFDRNGKPLMKWGSRGTGPGQFNTPHGIAVGGSPPRVFVADRGNRRIQVFDVNGRFLDEWPGIGPHTLMMSADEHVWAADQNSERIVKFDLNGHVEFAFGSFGTRPGYIWCAHQISADSDGNLYVAECFGGRTQQFRPKPNADPREMVRGRALMPMGKPGSQD